LSLIRAAARAAAASSLALLAAFLATTATCRANSLEVCDKPAEFSAAQKDQLLRFTAVVKEALAGSGHDVALVARSGLDLRRIDVRYSHEGVLLRDDLGAGWSVRELYYSCDDRKPRLFDEGLAGFLMGTDDPATSWVSIVFLPPAPAATLRHAAADRRQALGVLGSTYSANAYPFSTLFQNCNQWVIELLADALGRPSVGDDDAGTAPPADPADETAARARAQRWLRQQGYRPTVFTVSAHPMMWLADLMPWMSNADHPADELAHNRYNVSMPSSVETFVQAKVPGATRLEICHAGPRVVVHAGWDDVAEGCVAGPDDQVIELTSD
jgi:hypothetical protein